MQNYHRQNKKTGVGKLVILLLAIFVLLIMVGFFYWNYLQSPVNPKDTQLQAFVIVEGDSLYTIAQKLEDQRLIKSSFVFRQVAKSDGRLSKIEPGTVKISAAMSIKDIINALTEGSVDRWVTLLEGWRVEQMGLQIEAKLGIKKDEFIKAAKPYEGYLFPDTYLFNKEATVEDLVSTLRNTFDQRYTKELQQKIRSKGITPEQGVILASIVEREARSDKVRTEIAGILLKRFKMGMALNADATVQYAKDSQRLASGDLEKFWQPITQADYKNVDSPYNTYLHAALPPTPIANPSLSSLNAVANANPNTPYVYYYHDTKGNTYYAKTLDEHNANVARYK